MATLHLHLPEEREPCGYLAGREATMEYRVMTDVTPGELEWMLIRGWRRFGHLYFRPACPSCAECVSLRIPVDGFEASRSQRRARNRCNHLRIRTCAPIVDEQRLALYHAWHGMREDTRGWRASRIGVEEYTRTFAEPNPCAREMDYYDGDRLVGVGLIDETPSALSSIYFFYHPDVRAIGLGVASVLFEVEYARSRGLTHVYLGYRVRECPSTAYKSQFRPHDVLTSRPTFSETPAWKPPEHGPPS
ncbi:MAG TPA: arginyltransferase [Chthoniobacteraceae bacterium]|nr:arginyltransferase [Chthoniobacteraceae bacterium]